jgi:MFS transporter, FHS family, glucose/mannose:H+ symporter
MKADDAQRFWSGGWLYLGFMLTGTGTTLVGCLLPNLILLWHMSDARAGILFAAQFTGSALGAALVSSNYLASIARGYGLTIVSAVAIARFTGSPHVVLFFGFGLGLGLTMTATSLMTGVMFSEKRGAALSLLNACWGLGAAASPILASTWTRKWPPVSLYLVFAVALGAVLVFVRRTGFAANPQQRNSQAESASFPVELILVLGFIAFLYVGVESSVSGWMMSYVHRMTAAQNSWPPIVVSCFWIALLCGRVAAPAVLRRVSEQQLLTVSIVGALVSVSALIVSESPVSAVLSATASGLLLGPVYPLCVARTLALTHDGPATKWVLGVSGFGGAALPWLTGRLSTHNGSLRVGLFVPLAALGVMLALLLQITKRSLSTPAK